jgi:hypothetical protein
MAAGLEDIAGLWMVRMQAAAVLYIFKEYNLHFMAEDKQETDTILCN